MAESTFFTGPLRTKMSEDLQLTSKAQRTHDGYLGEIRKLADHCWMTPDQITEQQVRTYFLHLKNERKFAAGSLTVTLSALKFFYRITCPKDWGTLEQLRVKGPKALPEVITIIASSQHHRRLHDRTHGRLLLEPGAPAGDGVVGGREWSLVRAESLPLVAFPIFKGANSDASAYSACHDLRLTTPSSAATSRPLAGVCGDGAVFSAAVCDSRTARTSARLAV